MPETKNAVWAFLLLAVGSNLLYMAGLASLQVKAVCTAGW
jgi:choline-glycine betaine transporter